MRAAALLSLLLLTGCDEPSAPTTAGGAGRGLRGPADLPAPVAAPASPAPASRQARPVPSPQLGSPSRAEPAAAAPAVASPEAPTERDPLPDALRRAFGTPTDCISGPTRERLSSGDGARRLTVQVQVVVTGSGRVTRASVSGSQLAEDDLECLRRRAQALRIDVPIPDAPRSITAAIEYDVRSARITPSDPDPIAPRIPGQVAPSSTLPGAQTETERPPGFVPPSSTLPALAE